MNHYKAALAQLLNPKCNEKFICLQFKQKCCNVLLKTVVLHLTSSLHSDLFPRCDPLQLLQPIPLVFFIFLIFIKKSFFIGVQLLCNTVLVYTVQQSETAIRIHISPLFQISFPFRSPQNIEQRSLCYTVGSHQLSVLYIVVYICQSQSPNSSQPFFPLDIHTFVLYVCVSISAL